MLSEGDTFFAAEFLIVVVLLLLVLSNSLNFGVIDDAVGRIIFCLKPKRLPLFLFATCLVDVFSPPAKKREYKFYCQKTWSRDIRERERRMNVQKVNVHAFECSIFLKNKISLKITTS